MGLWGVEIALGSPAGTLPGIGQIGICCHLASPPEADVASCCATVHPHLQPLLEQLRDEFERLYPGIDFPAIPPKGTLDLDQLRQAAYFFS